jgi:hypothetical protein
MKIYVSHSRSFDFEQELYFPIRQHFLDSVHEFILPHENGSDKDLRRIMSTCDLVLAEVSFPAIGVGTELGRADAAGIRVVCVHRVGTTPSLSIRRITDDIREYDSETDLLRIIDESIERNRAIR